MQNYTIDTFNPAKIHTTLPRKNRRYAISNTAVVKIAKQSCTLITTIHGQIDTLFPAEDFFQLIDLVICKDDIFVSLTRVHYGAILKADQIREKIRL